MTARALLRLFPICLLALTLGACEARQTDEGEAPDVNVEGGDLPNYDVDVNTPDVNVGADTQTVVVPDVDVDTDSTPGQ